MPAAAVIPAPLVYTNAVAVKKLVVGFRAPVVDGTRFAAVSSTVCQCSLDVDEACPSPINLGLGHFVHVAQRPFHACYCEQNSVFQAVVTTCMTKHGIARHRPISMSFAGFDTGLGKLRMANSVGSRFAIWLRPKPLVSMVAGGEIRILKRAVKCSDFGGTNLREGIFQACLHQSRTKVLGAKMIRYRRSQYCKRCQLGIGKTQSNDFPCTAPKREIQAFGFRGKYSRKAET